MKELVKKLLLLSVSIIAVVAVMEPILRLKFADTVYVPGSTLARTQAYMRLRPGLGFSWKENIDYRSNVLLPWKDQEVFPLSTGPDGFVDPPHALQVRKEGRPVDIIGIGDSFMHVAAYYLHDYFWQQGLFYYSMAMPRYCPPQYNIVLKEYALELKPRWIVYGLYENDLDETADYENWRKTRMDWFTYHSGTWGGAPVGATWQARFVHSHLRGFYAMYRAVLLMGKHAVLKAAGGSDPLMRAGVTLDKKRVRDIYGYVREARDLAESRQIGFVLLIIPSHGMLRSGTSFKSRLYDGLIEMARADGIDVMDLRETFSKVPDGDALYYKIDGHWNKTGCVLAGKVILDDIRRHHRSATSSRAPHGPASRVSPRG